MSTEPPRRAATGDDLFIVGLVGRAGSGKSSVARALAEVGAEIIDADRLGHEITDRDPAVRAALEREYGADVYRADGALDRARVGARVFTDRAALARLNQLVHPRILAAIRGRIDVLRREGFRGVVVVDAALMLDWGFERECDAVIAVTAEESDQVARLMRARAWTEAQTLARLAAQRTNEAFVAAADAVVDNRGNEAAIADLARAAIEHARARRQPPA
jgi:dephospho-CoA kinase